MHAEACFEQTLIGEGSRVTLWSHRGNQGKASPFSVGLLSLWSCPATRISCQSIQSRAYILYVGCNPRNVRPRL